MKKLIIVYMCFIVCGILSGCVGYYKNYELVVEDVEYVNNTGLYIECNSNSVKKKKDIKNSNEDISLRSISTYSPASIVIHWYDVILNSKVQKHEKLEKIFEFEYDGEDDKYYPPKMPLGEFDLRAKERDKITVKINLTVIADGKEERRTIERTFVVKITTITKIDEWFSV